MTIFIITFSFALVPVILGFIALLKQKTYLDATNQQPVEVEVPLFGKLKTNYPALVFVVLGFALAFTAFDKSYPPKPVQWHISGTLKHPENRQIVWSEGILSFEPNELQITLSDQGPFTVDASVEEGKSFADIYETLDYTNSIGSVHLDLKKEIEHYRRGEASLIASSTEHTLAFKPLEITLYPPTE